MHELTAVLEVWSIELRHLIAWIDFIVIQFSYSGCARCSSDKAKWQCDNVDPTQ